MIKNGNNLVAKIGIAIQKAKQLLRQGNFLPKNVLFRPI